MRLLFVVQRYGHEVAGGAELHCRQFATILAQRGHEVEALTSTAVSYVDWANFYNEGEEWLDGVLVNRLPVAHAREDAVFGPLDRRVPWGVAPSPLYLQEEWMKAQGPLVPGIAPWLHERAHTFDAVIFFTYLYYTTWIGLPAAAGRTATVLHPTAHREPMIELSLYKPMFHLPDAFAFSTDEERDMVVDLFGVTQRSSIIGVGTELDVAGNGQRFRNEHAIGDDPYLLFAGRVDPGKGSDEIYDFFVAYKERRPGQLKLVVVGDPVKPLPPHPDVVVTGFVPDGTKNDAMAGAAALVQPSYFESFSMVLMEAWAHSLPALVQGHCDVLAGHARRSGGGIPYQGYAEFEAAVDMLLESPDLTRQLGRAGRNYVESRYSWDAVMGRYESLLRTVRRANVGV